MAVKAPVKAVVWHDLECGSYAADLALWRELAGSDGPRAILEIGAGTGRVALELARHGHHVTAVEQDRELVAELRHRASALASSASAVEPVHADARELSLPRRDFNVCVVAMQTIQLFQGRAGRAAFLRAARAHLAPGGVLACAIVTEVEPFDCARGDLGPTPETANIEGASFISRPVRVGVGRRIVRIERERTIVPAREEASRTPAAEPSLERDVVELDRVSVGQLEREGREAGLSALDPREISATSEHTGSVAVMFGA
jgi:SAM-dependent methyltransferase